MRCGMAMRRPRRDMMLDGEGRRMRTLSAIPPTSQVANPNDDAKPFRSESLAHPSWVPTPWTCVCYSTLSLWSAGPPRARSSLSPGFTRAQLHARPVRAAPAGLDPAGRPRGDTAAHDMLLQWEIGISARSEASPPIMRRRSGSSPSRAARARALPPSPSRAAAPRPAPPMRIGTPAAGAPRRRARCPAAARAR